MEKPSLLKYRANIHSLTDVNILQQFTCFFKDEIIVNQYLSFLKSEEFQRTKPAVPPSRPIEETLNDILHNSTLYQALKKLPKGGNMHIHESKIRLKGQGMARRLAEQFPSYFELFYCQLCLEQTGAVAVSGENFRQPV